MKKLLVLLFFIVGLFLLIITNTSWLPFGLKKEQTKVTDKIELIEIDVSGVRTTIIPENRSSVSTEYNGKGKVTVKESGDKIKVEFTSKNWLNLPSLFKKKDLTIFIPEDYNRDILINSGSGRLTFSGKSKKEPFKLENLSLNMTSGHVQLSNISTDYFEQVGSSGYIGINDFLANTSSFNMSSGKLDIKGYSGKVSAQVSSGRVDMQFEKLNDDIDLVVKSGFTTLDLPSDADFALNGEIGSGVITTSFTLTNSKKEKNKLEGIHGSDKHALNLNVSSGKIEVN
ncbi:hypothetical protein WQ54_00625 [Bacillus sp. SA1-12]|uniref:DUF4097 family beta strand repeat-containing protein n=1 Tax=Bacillus sp. SA1-12 TaxID=1455638 RepID=UPI000626CC09|nr:DUF4097 family beta strand repeat-containing protein [Bacillus sp. SA1-12]KKI94078.1 hypothetical protein WQ54_00625 [Bacillus sp. SA1-12]